MIEDQYHTSLLGIEDIDKRLRIKIKFNLITETESNIINIPIQFNGTAHKASDCGDYILVSIKEHIERHNGKYFFVLLQRD